MKPEAGRPHVAFAITALHGVAGGAERVLVDVANGLHRRGFPVSVLTFQNTQGPSFYPLDFGIRHIDGRRRDARGVGAPLTALSTAASRRRWIGVPTWLVRYGPKVIRFRQLLRLAKPDIAVGFLPSSYPYLTIAATGTGVRTIASLHNVPDRDLGGDPKRWDPNPVDIAARNRTLRRADATTVLLPSFVKQLEPAVRPKTYVIPNLIEPWSGPMTDVRSGDDNVILSVGRLSPAKDQATLIRAWARIEDRHPDWRVRIIGEGLLFEELVELIDELGVQRATIDPPTNEIEKAYTSSKILAMSSVHEGFGLVTAEAMACGLPVVGFADCEGTNEIVVDGENGLLVEPSDDRTAAYADALSRLIDNEAERVELAAQAPASMAAFHPDTVIDQWERMILDVHEGRVAP